MRFYAECHTDVDGILGFLSLKEKKESEVFL